MLQERGGHSSFSFAAAHPSTPSSRWWPPQPSRQTPARASDTDMGIPGHEGQGRQQARGSGGRCRPAGEHRLASRAMKAGQAADNSTGWVPAKARRGTVVGRHAGVWEGTGWPGGRPEDSPAVRGQPWRPPTAAGPRLAHRCPRARPPAARHVAQVRGQEGRSGGQGPECCPRPCGCGPSAPTGMAVIASPRQRWRSRHRGDRPHRLASQLVASSPAGCGAPPSREVRPSSKAT